MKKFNPIIHLASILLAFAIIIFCASCELKPKDTNVAGDNDRIPKDSMIIVMRAPGVTQDEFLEYIKEHNPSSIQYLCGSCDSSILLVPRSVLGGSGLAATGGSLPSDRPEGASIGYWCSNFKIIINKPTDQKNSQYGALLGNVNYTYNDPVTVAVLDTGVDSLMLANQNTLFKSDNISCLGNRPSIGDRANSGWNFVNMSEQINDDFDPTHGHGSNVAQLIIQQSRLIHKSPVKILPVKVLDSDGQGYLFDVLCGMAYAVERGAKIINLSLGFYVCDNEDSATYVFKEFIKNQIESKNVLLLAAAGNVEEDVHCGQLRDLTQTHFYPASFSQDLDLTKIIAVTTAGTDTIVVSPTQNYSGTVVDVAVMADKSSENGFQFRNPRNQLVSYIEGSSYATPIVSGAIAAAFHEFTSEGIFDKNSILTYLESKNKVVLEGNLINRNEVRKGRLLKVEAAF